MANATTETGLGIILRPRNARTGHARGQGLPAARGPRHPYPGNQLAWHLSSFALGLAVATISLGVFLVAYGIALRVIDGPGQSYPNLQHVSTQPTPRR